MSTLNHQAIATRLTADRLKSYRAATASLEASIDLYDWNIGVGASLHEDISRLEVIFRNTVDEALVQRGTAQNWPEVWYLRKKLFPGKQGAKATRTIEKARRQATRAGQLPEVHGKVIAELSFGFWRYLCTKDYLTSLWVPALVGAFPNHPDAADPRKVRADVESRIEKLHFLRNRIAHHEPIHQRNLLQDHRHALEILNWICTDSSTWASAASRSPSAIAAKP